MTHSGNRIDPDLIPGNIADGVEIFGVTGTLVSGGGTPTGTLLASESILTSEGVDPVGGALRGIYDFAWVETATHRIALYGGECRASSGSHFEPCLYISAQDKSTGTFVRSSVGRGVTGGSGADRRQTSQLPGNARGAFDVYDDGVGNIRVVYLSVYRKNFGGGSTFVTGGYTVYQYQVTRTGNYVSGGTKAFREDTTSSSNPGYTLSDMRNQYQTDLGYSESDRITNTENLTVGSENFELKSTNLNRSPSGTGLFPYILVS